MNDFKDIARKVSRFFSFHHSDLVLVFLVLAMVVFGLIMVYSASFIYAQERTGDGMSFIKKQIVMAFIGFIAMVGVSKIDYRNWLKGRFLILFFAFVLLGGVLLPGVGARIGGAQRWLKFHGFTFQPGEFAKFAIICFVAGQLTLKNEKLRTIRGLVFSQLLLPIPLFVFLLMQPDFGTTVLIGCVLFFLMFLAGVEKKLLFALILVSIAGCLWLTIGTEYRRMRLNAFLDPWSDPNGKGFQILQSLIGLHHGRTWGAGLGNGKEKLFYLPEAHNDFIFAVIGEELGFVGVLTVIFAYLYFIYRGLSIAMNSLKRHREPFGMLFATGLTLVIGFQSFINMAVVLGLLPTKGITLPFISYGGSAMLVNLFCVGVLLSIAKGPRTPVFK